MITAENFFLLGQGIVTICSSCYSHTIDCNRKLSALNWIVLDSGFNHNLNNDLIKLQLFKIGLSDCLIVLPDNFRMNDFMKIQIAYAEYTLKPIFYYKDGNFEGNSTHFPPSRSKVENTMIYTFINDVYKKLGNN